MFIVRTRAKPRTETYITYFSWSMILYWKLGNYKAIKYKVHKTFFEVCWFYHLLKTLLKEYGWKNPSPTWKKPYTKKNLSQRAHNVIGPNLINPKLCLCCSHVCGTLVIKILKTKITHVHLFNSRFDKNKNTTKKCLGK